MIWLARYWKPISGAVAILGAVWLIWAQVDAYGDRREKAGRAAVQALWDADELVEAQLAAKQVADNLAAETLAAELNRKQVDEQKAIAAAAVADRNRTYSLLRQARDSARASAAAQTGGGPGVAGATPDGGTGEADADARIDRQISAVIAERIGNDAQLRALIEVVKAQVP